jgi:hypothetical protein
MRRVHVDDVARERGVLMYQKEIHHERKRWELDWEGKWLLSLNS